MLPLLHCVTEIPLYLGKMMLLCSYAVTSRLRAQDSVTDVSNPFSRYRTQWGKSPRAVAGMEWEEIGLTLDTSQQAQTRKVLRIGLHNI